MKKAPLKIGLLTTGGTIASLPGEDGYEPKEGCDVLLTALADRTDVSFSCEDVCLLDSTDVGPELWVELAHRIRACRDTDAVIITHGTDTMAYTAAALSFLLCDLSIPVIITGAQRAADHPEADGPANLNDAMAVACDFAGEVSGVYLVFGGRVIHGTHAVKTDTRDLRGFSSVGAPYAADVVDGRVTRGDGMINSRTGSRPEPLPAAFAREVLAIHMTPGADLRMLDAVIRGGERPLRGLLLESFGLGGLPADVFPYVKRWLEQGLFVVIGTQVATKDDDLHVYEVGARAAKIGAVPQGGMTTEAAIVKMMWILASCDDPLQRRQLFADTLFAGEGATSF